jgi:hypothetical protein
MEAARMLILVTIMFLLTLVLLALYLYVSGVFTKSESVPVWLFYPVGLLCADHRDWHSFLPRLRPPGHNPGVAE